MSLSSLRRLDTLRSAPTRSGSGTRRAAPGAVDREGGIYRSGLISGASVITVGEALGHGFWIDSEFLAQTAESLPQNPTNSRAKVRFTHPGLSSDGLGTLLGRASAPRLSGDGTQLLADVHLLASARSTPDGDLASYTMSLAEESPDLFGTSIVFTPDHDAMEKFVSENQVDYEVPGPDGKPQTKSRFQSPDPDNIENLPHARLAILHAMDIVDQPAANPGGMFASLSAEGRLIDLFDETLSYVLGLSSEEPAPSDLLPVHPSRIKRFLAQYLADRNLSIAVDGFAESCDSDISPPNEQPHKMSILKKSTDNRQLAAARADIAELEQQVDTLIARLQDAEARSQDLSEDLSVERIDHGGTADDLAAANARIQRVETDLAAARKDLDQFDARVAETARAAVEEELAKHGHAPLDDAVSYDLPSADPAAELEKIHDPEQSFLHARKNRGAILEKTYARR